MSTADWILLGIIGIAVCLSIRRLAKKKGCSCGCENCSNSCRKQ